MDQAAIDAHLAERRRTVAGKGASRLREAMASGADEALEAELHRLAGTLGTFGMHQASLEARALLVALRECSLERPDLIRAISELAVQLEEAS